MGYYYNNPDFTALAFTRNDAQINFDWGTATPDPRINADTFSVRWTGRIIPQYSETYTFYMDADDGVRLWVNGVLMINSWTGSGERTSTPISLIAGTRYMIQIDYNQNINTAKAILSWSSASVPKAIVPQVRLFVR